MGVTDEPVLLTSMSGKSSFRISIPTLGPAVIASHLLEHGVGIEVYDYFQDDIDWTNARIIGISSTFMDLDTVREIAARIRCESPSAAIILGGPLSWSVPTSDLLAIIPELDYVVEREGEETFLDLITALSQGRGAENVRGIVYRSQQGPVRSPARNPLSDEQLPRPAWELMGIPSDSRLPVLPVETSRGCPYNCAYCSEVRYWGKPVRYKTPERVTNELLDNAIRYGIRTFRFADSCFSAPVSRSAVVCDRIYEDCTGRGYDIRWSCYARIENLSAVLLEKMKRSGCIALDIGVESGDIDILQRMGRKYSPEIAVKVSHMARDIGIITNFNIVVGFPGETRESIKRTIDILNRAAPDTFSCFQLFLAQNSAAYLNPHEYGIEGEGLTWKHSTMSSEQAAQAMVDIPREVTCSTSFPGGEYVACYLTSVGYGFEEIRRFYRAMATITEESDNHEALATLGDVFKNLEKYL